MTDRTFSIPVRLLAVVVSAAGIASSVGLAMATSEGMVAAAPAPALAPATALEPAPAPAAPAAAVRVAESAAYAVLTRSLVGTGVRVAPDGGYDYSRPEPAIGYAAAALDEGVRAAERAACAELQRRLTELGIAFVRERGELRVRKAAEDLVYRCGDPAADASRMVRGGLEVLDPAGGDRLTLDPRETLATFPLPRP